MGKLKVTIISARDLDAKDIGGTSDPFVVVTIGQIKRKTDHILKNCNPTWNTTLFFDLPPSINASTESATFEVFDYDRMSSSDLIGRTTVALGTLYKGQPQRVDLKLSNSKNGILSVELLAEDFGQFIPIPQQNGNQMYQSPQYPYQQQPMQGYPQQFPQQGYPQQFPPQGYPPQYNQPQQPMQGYPPQYNQQGYPPYQ